MLMTQNYNSNETSCLFTYDSQKVLPDSTYDSSAGWTVSADSGDAGCAGTDLSLRPAFFSYKVNFMPFLNWFSHKLRKFFQLN